MKNKFKISKLKILKMENSFQNISKNGRPSYYLGPGHNSLF
jgi:hypothetical protein